MAMFNGNDANDGDWPAAAFLQPGEEGCGEGNDQMGVFEDGYSFDDGYNNVYEKNADAVKPQKQKYVYRYFSKS